MDGTWTLEECWNGPRVKHDLTVTDYPTHDAAVAAGYALVATMTAEGLCCVETGGFAWDIYENRFAAQRDGYLAVSYRVAAPVVQFCLPTPWIVRDHFNGETNEYLCPTHDAAIACAREYAGYYAEDGMTVEEGASGYVWTFQTVETSVWELPRSGHLSIRPA